MATSHVSSKLEILNKLEKLTKHPEYFLGIQSDVAEEITKLTKILYDGTKREEDGQLATKDALPELIVNDFDEEQIWQELELQNVGRTESLISDISLLVVRKDQLKFPVQLEGESYSDADLNPEESLDEEDHAISDEDEEIEESLSLPTIKKGGENIFVKKRKKSIVDDRFFKLSDLDTFLSNEDVKANRELKKDSGDSSNDSDEDSINLFDDNPSDNSGNEHYEDFFDAPDEDGGVDLVDNKLHNAIGDDNSEGGDDELDEENTEIRSGEENDQEYEHDRKGKDTTRKGSEKGSKKVRFMEDDSEELPDSAEPSNQEIKSNFEIRQERLKTRISKLESEALGDKPWQLKGEVAATSRPQNSLLEEVVEFDLTSRPAPIITEQTTLKLEDLIKQRIRDKAWDDVERKVKPVKTPEEYRKQLVLNQEKSKQSLAEVYEEEYIKQRDNLVDAPVEDPPAHQQIRALMSSLFAKLDALSNFHFTPKPATAEVKIVSNIPAITMEEVAPVATASGTLLAPEEIKAKPKGDPIGKGERTSSDRKRERRHKKMMQRDRQNAKLKQEKLVNKLRPGLGNKYSKEKTAKMLETVTKEKNVSKMEQTRDSKSTRSSKAFFNQLQEEVSTHIKSKTNNNKRQKIEKVSAKRMKL